jgi:hypothetical protein
VRARGPPGQLVQLPSSKTLLHSRGAAPRKRDPASFEGRSPPRVGFRLARGPFAPSDEVPPRSRPSQARCPVPTPPTGEFNALTPTGKPTHADPLTRLRIIPRRCSTNPPGEAIPATVQHCAVRPGSAPWHYAAHSHTTDVQHPRRRTAEPSKGDGCLSRTRPGPRRDVGPARRVSSVTIGPM